MHFHEMIIMEGDIAMAMTAAQILEKMIEFSDGNVHDIEHLTKVWAYARTIGQLEGLDEETQFITEVAAIVHDIACPLCREKYGSSRHIYQELEGEPMSRDFLSDKGLSLRQIERISFIVGHHHSLTKIDGVDFQIVAEADYIVNACEQHQNKTMIEGFLKNYAKTDSGIRLIRSVLSDTLKPDMEQ